MEQVSKYLCLGYYDEKKFDALPREEMRAIVSRCAAHDEALRNSGHLVSVASLQAPGKAVSIRPRQGKPTVTDGPFAETKEQLGSFFIVEAASMEEAVKIASLHPAAHLGETVGWGVEVRAIDRCRAREENEDEAGVRVTGEQARTKS